MFQHPYVISPAFEVLFLGLQFIIVAFLLLHDWIPLGRLNNLAAIRSEDSIGRRVFVTLLPAVPAAIALYFCLRYIGQPYPHWLEMELWITYGIFFAGLMQAWWIPYLLLPDPKRAARYQALFAGTHTFLPRRNGIAPDTLHTIFHIVLVATMIAIFLRERLASPFA